jgi:hypothetical protein
VLARIICFAFAHDPEKWMPIFGRDPLRLADGARINADGGSLSAHLRDSETRIEYRGEDFDRLKYFFKNVEFWS